MAGACRTPLPRKTRDVRPLELTIKGFRTGHLNNSTASDAIPDMIWTYDLFGQIDYVNAAWISYTGLNLVVTVAQPTLWTSVLS